MSGETKRRAGREAMAAWLALGFLVLTAAGCARPDWIEQTLVTVDVTGVWQGTIARAGSHGPLKLTLQQSGPKVTGQLKGTTSGMDGPLEGTVTGDIFRFRSPRAGVSGELQVNGDEMTGSGTTQGDPGTMTLRREQ